MWSDRCRAAVHREMNWTLQMRKFIKILSCKYLASREDKRGREEKNARFILRITAAAFSLALPNTWESIGWEDAQDNLMEPIWVIRSNDQADSHLSSSLVCVITTSSVNGNHVSCWQELLRDTRLQVSSNSRTEVR